ncbi:MAG: septum formation inhibitor Maf [bacterium]|nr:septum formation inhibitor Maf [bacterium]
MSEHNIILASNSSGRAALLKGAGISFTKNAADLDERAIEETLTVNGVCPDPVDVALVLARAKAEYISQSEKDAYVIGADQVLVLDDKIFEKPANMDIVRNNLLEFRGRIHYLHSAVCVARKGEIIWQHVETASMTMRDFSTDFLAEYLVEAGESVKTSVGAYRLEETGIHLFEKIEGDYFTILGLPLIPLLDFLREQGIVVS